LLIDFLQTNIEHMFHLSTLTRLYVLTALHNAVYACYIPASVWLSVCYRPILYQNGSTHYNAIKK